MDTPTTIKVEKLKEVFNVEIIYQLHTVNPPISAWGAYLIFDFYICVCVWGGGGGGGGGDYFKISKFQPAILPS